MPKPNHSLAFDFAKDFDREDEEKKLVAQRERKKANAEARKSAEKFSKVLRAIAKKAGYNDRNGR